jgi:V/A-type H+-transporting ATPase subunit D
VTALRGLPAGRAGRAWLQGRLATASRAAELLRGKLRVLQREEERSRREADRAAAEWAATWSEAETWLVRAVLLGGRRAVVHAAPSEPAEVDVVWRVSMGVHHPVAATVHGGRPAPTAALPGNSALVQAATAHRAALAAAARYAAAAEAQRRIDAEVTATRRRLRAVEGRWIPRLTGALHEVEAGLAETELAEGNRLRWAHGVFRAGE